MVSAGAEGQQSLSDDQAVIAMDSCAQMLAARYDDKLGGFGNAPKFPRPSDLNLLLVQDQSCWKPGRSW